MWKVFKMTVMGRRRRKDVSSTGQNMDDNKNAGFF